MSVVSPWERIIIAIRWGVVRLVMSVIAFVRASNAKMRRRALSRSLEGFVMTVFSPYYQDDRVTIYLGDCLEIMPTLPDKSVDMILCDLPYGTTACKWDTIIPFEPLWENYKRLIKGNGAIVLTASQPFTSRLVMSNLPMFKYEWIWDKDRPSGFALCNKRPMPQHENILIFSQGQTIYNPQMTTGRPSANGWNKTKEFSSQPKLVAIKKKYTDQKFPKTIIYEKKNGASTYLHPTQKPVALFEYLIRTYTNEGDTVLDNCAGSGTTGVAAKKTGRKSIQIEKEMEYVKIAVKRLAQGILSFES